MTVFRSSNLSSEIHKYRPSISYHAAPAGRRNKMLEWRLATLNASSPTMSHALGKTKAARIGVIFQECLKCSSLLACKAPRAQISICFPSSLSRIHLAASLLCSPDCFQDILFATSWEFSLEEVGISQTCQVTHLLGGTNESTSLDLKKANGMLTSHATRIFSGIGFFLW